MTKRTLRNRRADVAIRASAFVALALAMMVAASTAFAAPVSHILRVDPRAGIAGGKPILTTVIELTQFKSVSDTLLPCASVKGAADTMTCWSKQIETPGNIYTPVPGDALDGTRARFVVKVGGADTLTTFQDKVQWGKAKDQPGVGTAWLITLDASSTMGARYVEARAVAQQFLATMEANDLVNLMIFDDRMVIATSGWKTLQQRNDVVATLNAHTDTAPSHGNDRALFDQIKKMTTDGFGALGNWGTPATVPLHQAMVVLSNGTGRNDPASASPTAAVFAQYLDNGRFPDNNPSIPRTPLPVISIYFPNHNMGLVGDLYKNNESQFMQSLANPEIGGLFDVVQEGQGAAKSPAIIKIVRGRFDNMWIVHWLLSCLNPTVLQTFNLFFENVNPTIAPDGTMSDIPIGVDPTQWPLNIDYDKTQKEALVNPLYPGGTFKVYGDFCWGGDKGRGEAYFIPTGTKPPAQNATDPNQVKSAMQSLIAQNMRGSAADIGDTFALFNVPDDAKVLDGAGDAAVAHIVIYDNSAKRASGVDAKTVLTLKATTKPLNMLLIGGIAGGVIVILLLLVVLLRGGGGGGGGGRKRGNAPPPPAQPPPPQYGGAPPYGAPPQQPPYGGSGGYNMQAQNPSVQQQAPPQYAQQQQGPPQQYAPPPQQAMFSPPAAAPMGVQPAQSSLEGGMAAPAVVQVRCPACQMMTMATPGQPSVCFSCGQPLPANIAGGGGGGSAPAFPLTGGMPEQPPPPPNPYLGGSGGGGGAGGGGMGTMLQNGYGMAPPSSLPSAATIRSQLGQFTIRPGAEVRVGRDPAQCPVYIAEPRVSGVHASLKFDAGQLWVRDETSNNGTWIAGSRVPAGAWAAVPPGTQLRFGPIEFAVHLEA